MKINDALASKDENGSNVAMVISLPFFCQFINMNSYKNSRVGAFEVIFIETSQHQTSQIIDEHEISKLFGKFNSVARMPYALSVPCARSEENKDAAIHTAND